YQKCWAALSSSSDHYGPAEAIFRNTQYYRACEFLVYTTNEQLFETPGPGSLVLLPVVIDRTKAQSLQSPSAALPSSEGSYWKRPSFLQRLEPFSPLQGSPLPLQELFCCCCFSRLLFLWAAASPSAPPGRSESLIAPNPLCSLGPCLIFTFKSWHQVHGNQGCRGPGGWQASQPPGHLNFSAALLLSSRPAALAAPLLLLLACLAAASTFLWTLNAVTLEVKKSLLVGGIPTLLVRIQCFCSHLSTTAINSNSSICCPDSSTMAFSELLQHVGNFGRFQILLGILLSLLNILMNTHNYAENFSGAIPAHRCYTNLLDNATFVTNNFVNLTTEALLRVSIPMAPNYKPEQCRRFRETQWQLLDADLSITNMSELETEPCLDGWVYDQSIFTSTIVTKWDLVCDKQSLKSLSQSIFMAGQMVGTPISGYFADRFGRKPILLCFSMIIGLLGTCLLFAPTFQVYCVLRFLIAISLGTVFGNSVTFLIEWIPTKVQPPVMTALSLSMSSGQVILAGLAYLFRDWHILQLVISVPYFVFFLLLWFSSESARWLIIADKLERALKELKRVAKFNGKKEAAENLSIEILKSTMQEELALVKRHSKIKEVLASSVTCKILCYLCFIRFSAVFFVFGLMLDLRNLGGNLFLSQALLGAIDIPAKFLSIFVMKFVNRRTSIIFVLFLAGSSVLVNIFVPQGEINTDQIFDGESCVQGTFVFVGSLGGAVGSLVLMTKQYFPPLPMILYGSLPILASICAYFLPETRNLPLPDTVMDVERRFKVLSAHPVKSYSKDRMQGVDEEWRCEAQPVVWTV
ncbi:Solute carrier family 22 member 22, partial [Galemys pyrenaicus]